MLTSPEFGRPGGPSRVVLLAVPLSAGHTWPQKQRRPFLLRAGRRRFEGTVEGGCGNVTSCGDALR